MADGAEVDPRQSRLVPPGLRRLPALRGGKMMDIVRNIESALVFAFIGIVVFVVSFVTIDRMTPYDLWREIVQEKNMALALLIGAMSIGVCIIIAAAVH